MKKKILTLALTLLVTSLHARRVTIIKNQSAAEIKTLNYISYYTTQSDQIIGSKFKNTNFNKSNVVTFTIADNHTHLEIILPNINQNVSLSTQVTFKAGKEPLRYKLQKAGNKIVLLPMFLKQ